MAAEDPHHIAWVKNLLTDEKARHDFCDKTFIEADEDKSGDLGVDEVVNLVFKICRSMTLKMPEKDRIAELVKLCDKSGDGDLQKVEFRTAFKAVLKACLNEAEKESEEERTARLEAERLEEEAEKAEAERLAAEKAAAEKAEAERLEAEKAAAEKAQAERLAAEKAAAEGAEAERVAAEKAAAEKAEAERLEAEKAAAEKADAERLAAEKEAAAEKAATEKAAAEKAAAEKAAAEKAAAAKNIADTASPATNAEAVMKTWTKKQVEAYTDSMAQFDAQLKIAEKALSFLKTNSNPASIKAKTQRTELMGSLPKLAEAIDLVNKGEKGNHDAMALAFGSTDRLTRLKTVLTAGGEFSQDATEFCVQYLMKADEEVAQNAMHAKSFDHLKKSYEGACNVVKESGGHARRKSSFDMLGKNSAGEFKQGYTA